MLLLLPRLSRCSQSSCSLTSLGLNRARPAPPYRHSSKTSSSSSAFKTSFLSLHSSSVHRQKGLLLFSSSPISLISVKSSSAWSLSLKRNQVSPAKAIMAPVEGTGVKAKVQELIKSHTVMVFSKTTCPFCDQIKELFKERQIQAQFLELDTLGEEGTAIQEALLEISGQKTVPNVFINGKHLGGCSDTLSADASGQLKGKIRAGSHNYQFDTIVIGGGSGGLVASKECSRLGQNVAVFDFVQPTPLGTTWGLGGTCVNVGCIPKKLMHQAALLGGNVQDAQMFGWKLSDDNKPILDWPKMVEAIQNHIGSLNWGYKVALRDKKVKYLNEYARFVDAHTIKGVNKKGKETEYTAQNFILAMGGRPKYPDIPGAKELGITSDDLFSLPYNPGKTLCVGASYISLECAGFLKGAGLDTTVMVRSILLRGFDQQMANKIGEYMEEEGVNFIRECVPYKMERVEEGQPGKIKVYAKYNDGTEYTDVFNTVLFAIGRDPCTAGLGLEEIGVKLAKNGKIVHDEAERTSVSNIYAIGDVLQDKAELTPLAIKQGMLLARRITLGDELLTHYENIATTVFTPLEYGCVGLSEEDAEAKYGKDDIEVFHKNFWPLEWTLAKRSESACYIKLVCLRSEDMKVVGFHYLGPNAGEVTQGYAGMMVMGAKKADFDKMVGIHPTNAEWFINMDITKSSGVSPTAAGC